jgi:V/A-type H+-transporting ATPase subunit I
MRSGDKKEYYDSVVEKIRALIDEKNALKGELVKAQKNAQALDIYQTIRLPFSVFNSTQNTKNRLGVVPTASFDALQNALSEMELCAVETLAQTSESVLLFVVAHKQAEGEMSGVLSAFGFADCPYTGEQSGEQAYQSAVKKCEDITSALKENAIAMYALKEEIRGLKVYLDYNYYLLEKEETNGKLSTTQTTFIFEAFVPAPSEEKVKNAIDSLGGVNYYEFSEPLDTDEPPTLLKNNAVVGSFEGITNTYSAPNYREFDPNTVMSFFYSLFMGFIIGDAGYGFLMLLIGGLLWAKHLKRPTGMSRLAGAFALGGLFAIMWGALFNSFFGFMILPSTVMPNPQTDMWLLAGIKVPSVLIIAMELGIFQIFVGYICKAWQHFRRGEVLDGIFSGVLWAIFSVGLALAIVGFVEEANLPFLATYGGITAGVALGLAVITAGWKEKFFGKFTKGFGAAYGVINYASDILSYARLYGLMLSGAVIAQIIATYGGGFIVSGNILLVILGVVIMLVGHAFNLVMNLLGAYIHDARLQYVEFYGRFFEGEGELFAPLGSSQKYVYLLRKE